MVDPINDVPGVPENRPAEASSFHDGINGYPAAWRRGRAAVRRRAAEQKRRFGAISAASRAVNPSAAPEESPSAAPVAGAPATEGADDRRRGEEERAGAAGRDRLRRRALLAQNDRDRTSRRARTAETARFEQALETARLETQAHVERLEREAALRQAELAAAAAVEALATPADAIPNSDVTVASPPYPPFQAAVGFTPPPPPPAAVPREEDNQVNPLTEIYPVTAAPEFNRYRLDEFWQTFAGDGAARSEKSDDGAAGPETPALPVRALFDFNYRAIGNLSAFLGFAADPAAFADGFVHGYAAAAGDSAATAPEALFTEENTARRVVDFAAALFFTGPEYRSGGNTVGARRDYGASLAPLLDATAKQTERALELYGGEERPVREARRLVEEGLRRFAAAGAGPDTASRYRRLRAFALSLRLRYPREAQGRSHRSTALEPPPTLVDADG